MKKRTIRKRIIDVVSVLFCLVCVCLSNHTSLADETEKKEAINDGIVVVSMGDSYSSGEGNTPFYGENDPYKETNQDWLAHRSEECWPGRLTFEVDGTEYMLKDCRRTADQAFDPGKKVSWYFVAASGAETKHINGQQEKEYCFKRYEELDENGWLRTYETIKNEKDHPALLDPQINVFNSIPKGAVDYVTLTLGGNDVKFSKVVEQWAVTPAKSYLMANNLNNMFMDIWKEFFGKYEIDEAKVAEIKKKSDFEIAKEIKVNHDLIYNKLVETYGEERAKYFLNPLFTKMHIEVLYGNKKEGVRDRLKNAYIDICNAAGPQATLIVVGYPQLFSGDTFLYFFNDDASTKVNSEIHTFNDEIKKIVNECRNNEGMKIEFVSVEEEFKNHGAYSDKGKQWLHRIMVVKREEDLDSGKFVNLVSAYSVHPNEKGIAAYARLVQKKIDELEKKRKDELVLPPTNIPSPTLEPTPTESPIPPTDTPMPTETPIPTPTDTPTPTPSSDLTHEELKGTWRCEGNYSLEGFIKLAEAQSIRGNTDAMATLFFLKTLPQDFNIGKYGFSLIFGDDLVDFTIISDLRGYEDALLELISDENRCMEWFARIYAEANGCDIDEAKRLIQIELIENDMDWTDVAEILGSRVTSIADELYYNETLMELEYSLNGNVITLMGKNTRVLTYDAATKSIKLDDETIEELREIFFKNTSLQQLTPDLAEMFKEGFTKVKDAGNEVIGGDEVLLPLSYPVYVTMVGKAWHIYSDCPHINNADSISEVLYSDVAESDYYHCCSTCAHRYIEEKSSRKEKININIIAQIVKINGQEQMLPEGTSWKLWLAEYFAQKDVAKTEVYVNYMYGDSNLVYEIKSALSELNIPTIEDTSS